MGRIEPFRPGMVHVSTLGEPGDWADRCDPPNCPPMAEYVSLVVHDYRMSPSPSLSGYKATVCSLVPSALPINIFAFPSLPFDTVIKQEWALWNSTHFVQVHRLFPSTKQCVECGYQNDNLTLFDRQSTCPACETEHIRDLNAAKNIRAEALELVAQGAGHIMLLDRV
jgi:hypothetical protein